MHSNRITPPNRLMIAFVLGLAAHSLIAESTIQFRTRLWTVAETARQAELSVVRSTEVETEVSVDYSTMDLTATAGQDYIASTGSLTFAAGQTNQTIAVSILNDGIVEGLERFQVLLTNATAGAILGSVKVATVSIQDNDTPIEFTGTSIPVGEAQGTIEVMVARGDDSDVPVSVDYATVDGTALAGADYEAIRGTLTFETGPMVRGVTIHILNDTVLEANETFAIELSNLQGAGSFGSNTNATVSIVDNETPVNLEFGAYWAREDEESVSIGVVRGGEGEAVTLDYATADGTAVDGEDYTSMRGTLTFEAGENLKLLSIPILNDGIKEPEQTFRIYLTNAPVGMVATPYTATITIRDNDAGVQFLRNAVWIQERERSIALTVTRSNDGVLGPFTVDYETRNDTATSGEDYIESRGTLAFAEGQMTQSFVVSVIDDEVPELDERFTVTLSNPTSGLTLGNTHDTTVAVTLCDTTEMLPHRFDTILVSEDGTVALTLSGGVTEGLGLVNRFRPYYDLFPVEVSGNLIDWTTLTNFVRREASPDVMTIIDPESKSFGSRFYRTPTTERVAPSPPPTGPYAVGRIDRLVTDPDRRNRYGISTNGSFMLSLWYPALTPVGQAPVPFHDRAIATDSSIYGWGNRVDVAAYMVSHSFRDVPFAAMASPCPVVFYSHGFNDWRDSGQDKAENLASHGFVVVAVDHFDCYNTVFSDGTQIKGAEGRDMDNRGLADRLRDFHFVHDRLAEWNRSDPLLAGTLDLDRIGVFGFSWGGVTAAELAHSASWCRVAVLLDPGGVSGALPGRAMSKPSLTMRNAAEADSAVYSSSTSAAVWFQISSTVHYHFASWYFWDRSLAVPVAQEVVRTINAYLLWFMNPQLRDSTDPMPALADYPRVINFKQK